MIIPKSSSIIVILLLGLFFVYNSLLSYVGPNEFGVIQNKLGGGIQKDIKNTGLHIVIPVMEDIFLFPKDLMVFDMAKRHTVKRVKGRVFLGGAAHIQTSDGFYVDVDVSVFFRIKDAYKVVSTYGTAIRN